MDELQQWLRQYGIELTPILDGKVHRFSIDGSKEKDQWYIGSVVIQGNKRITSLTWGDWRVDEKYTFRSGGADFNEVDREKYYAHVNERKKEAEKERVGEQEEAAKEAERIWNQGLEIQEWKSDYLQRKQVNEASKWIKRTDDGILLIPVKDRSGRLWGIQRIWPNGDKKFTPGTKKQGCFFEFDGRDPLVVCEGFATGASIHLATGFRVRVAFDAGNLRNVVQEGCVVCGDDDRWGDSGKNVGREKATEAAESVGGIACFPEGLLQGETDFNDIYVRLGNEEVRRQIENAIRNKEERKQQERFISKEEPPEQQKTDNKSLVQPKREENDISLETQEYLNCLGHSEDDYFYTSSSNKQIQCISKGSHTWSSFADLMPYSYWANNYGSQTKKGFIIPWDKIAFELMEKCRLAGVFNPENIRGSGCWSEGHKLVLHLGDRVVVDDKIYPVGKVDGSSFVYELGKKIPDIHVGPLTNKECETLVSIVHLLKWKDEDHAKYFLGWLAISRISGALNWRPHGWLTGPSGSGKSTLIERVIAPIIGKWGLQFIGSSSEAGIRQAIGSDSRPVVLDEAETTNKKTGNRIQNVLELIRQSSSSTNAKIAKGTSSQDGMQFKINCLFLLSSIRVNLSEEADKNRFTEMELLRNDPEKWPEINEKLTHINEEYGDRLFSRMIKSFAHLLKNKELLAHKIASRYNQRIGQQYGTLLAGYVSLFTTGEISNETAENIVNELNIFSTEKIEIEEDENECLNHLCSFPIRISNGDNDSEDSSLGLLIDLASQEKEKVNHYCNQLRLWGIKAKEDGTVFIANHHPQLARVFRDTKWDGIWRKALRRIPNAKKFKERLYPKQSQVHGTLLLKSSIISD